MRLARLFSSVFAIACVPSLVTAEDKVERAEAMRTIQQLGGQFLDARPMGMSVNFEPIPSAIIPFWAIVIPLTLLAGYLLLSKPKPRLIPVKVRSR